MCNQFLFNFRTTERLFHFQRTEKPNTCLVAIVVLLTEDYCSAIYKHYVFEHKLFYQRGPYALTFTEQTNKKTW